MSGLPGYDAWLTTPPDPEPTYSALFAIKVVLDMEAYLATDKDGVPLRSDVDEFLSQIKNDGRPDYRYCAEVEAASVEHIALLGDVQVEE